MKIHPFKMFCKAITSRGSPCIASCKADSVYCHHHDGMCVECPVCVEEVPHIRQLPCGHHLCVECLHSLTSDSCPICRRVGIIRVGVDIRPLRDTVVSLYNNGHLPEYVNGMDDDVESIRLALLDLVSVLYASPESKRSTQYIDTVHRLLDFACIFHIIAFRDPRFLDYLFDAETGLPYTDPDPRMRRFIMCLDSFRHRVGGLPAFDRTRASSEWLAHLGEG